MNAIIISMKNQMLQEKSKHKNEVIYMNNILAGQKNQINYLNCQLTEQKNQINFLNNKYFNKTN